MTVWEIYLVTLNETKISIFDSSKNVYVYQGINADIPLECLKCVILNVTVGNNSDLKITIW